jgi:hypothetical protein
MAKARFQLTNVRRGIGREYQADIEIDGRTVGRVERAESGKGGGFRAGQYRAKIGHLTVATGETLADLREELREHFAEEYPDASGSW